MTRSTTTTAGALALALLLGACALPTPSVPGTEPTSSGGSGGGGDAPAATSWAGTWTRQGDAPLVFTVTDDGSKVHGERTSGGEDVFTSYSFDLTRKGQGLEGTATFALADVAGKTYEATWKATLDGSTIKVKGEELLLDPDSNEVTGREPKDLAFDFAAAPSADAGGAAPPPPPPAMDMSQFVTPAPNYKHLLADDLAVGHWVEVETKAGPMTMKQRTACVHDAGDAWVFELDNQMNDKDLLLAVFVSKETGDVSKAYVGKRGKEAKEKAVSPPPAQQAGEAPEGTPEEVTVPAGTFPAKKFVTEAGGSTFTSWVGTEGEAEGVLLKSETSQGTDELKTLETVTVEVTGASFECRHLAYTGGNEMWMAQGTLPHLKQLVRMKAPSAEIALVGQGEDAKPEMEYPR